jgi:hypothetical protein
VSSSDKIGKLYRNQGNLFAIDDTNDDESSNNNESTGTNEVECVNLNLWLEKPDTLNKFKCFYREKSDKKKPEWVPGYLFFFFNFVLFIYFIVKKKNFK